jgi:5,10-methylenetetrahydrofolate reductase
MEKSSGSHEPGLLHMVGYLSKLEALLKTGQFAVCAELEPPQSANADAIYRKIAFYRDVVDAVNVTDNASAIVRMSSLAASAMLVREGLEPVLQMTCRDRNRIALQSDILGAAGLGIRNVLCLTGDHQTLGDHPTAKGVFDLDACNFLRMARRMRDEKRFFSGGEIKTEPRFFIGAGANPFAEPFQWRVRHLAKKIDAGAEFIQTQCVFDLERFDAYMAQIRAEGIHERAFIIAGVSPAKSARALEYMKEHVPGMMIPDALIARMKQARDPEAEGVAMALEIIAHIRQTPGIRGIHIMPLKWPSVIPTIVKESGLLPRPVVDVSSRSGVQA